MRRFDKILAACDLSVCSEPVLDCAASLADKMGSELVIVHVINRRNIDALIEAVHKIVPEETGMAMTINEYIESLQKERVEQLDALVRQTSMAGRRIRKLFRIGIPYEEILSAARSENADLLVIGSRGRSNISGLLFGRTAERVLRNSSLPVLTVRTFPCAASQPMP